MFTIPELQAARQPKNLKRLDCPHCGETLNRHVPLVIATRNCPACGRCVMAGPEGESSPTFTREALDDACAAYARAAQRAIWVVLVGLLVLLAVLSVLVLYRDTIRAAVEPVLDPTGFFFLVAFGPCGVCAAVAHWQMSRARRNALKCPHCNGPCSVVGVEGALNPTQLTGNCAYCGQRLLNEFLPEESAGSLPTVEEFKAANRRALKASWLMLVPVAEIVIFFLFGLFVLDNPGRLWQRLEDRYGVMNGTIIGSVVLFGLALVAGAISIAIMRWVLRRQMRKRAADPVLNCPHCRSALAAVFHVVASKRCPLCRKRVLADPEPTLAAAKG